MYLQTLKSILWIFVDLPSYCKISTPKLCKYTKSRNDCSSIWRYLCVKMIDCNIKKFGKEHKFATSNVLSIFLPPTYVVKQGGNVFSLSTRGAEREGLPRQNRVYPVLWEGQGYPPPLGRTG